MDRSFDFVVSRLGDPKPVLHGGRVAGRFRIHIPDKMRTGVYVVRVRAGRDRAVWPLAVAGLPPPQRARRGAAARRAPRAHLAGAQRSGRRRRRLRRQAAVSRAVRVDRPFAGGGCRRASTPRCRRSCAGSTASGFRTTSPPTSRSPATRGRRWATHRASRSPEASCGCPSELLKRLRDYVADGGRLAAFGADSFRRAVRLRARWRATRRRGGARTRSASEPLVQHERGAAHRLRGRARAVRGRTASWGTSRCSRPAGLPESARRLTEAGRDPGQPAFVAYGLGGGIVIRVGTPQWARELDESALSLELPQVTKRIWSCSPAAVAREPFAILRRVTRRRLLWEAGSS